MREFTVRMANRPGKLAALSELLAAAGVNIEALAGFARDDESVVHMIVDDETATRAVLLEAGVGFEERDVISTTLPHRPGALATVTRALADAEVNIETVYLLRSSRRGLEFAISVDAVEPARRVIG